MFKKDFHALLENKAVAGAPFNFSCIIAFY